MAARKPKSEPDTIDKFEGKKVIDITGKLKGQNPVIVETLGATPKVEHVGDVGYAIIKYRVGSVNHPERRARSDEGEVEVDREQILVAVTWVPIDEIAASTAVDEQEARNLFHARATQKQGSLLDEDGNAVALSDRVEAAFVEDPVCGALGERGDGEAVEPCSFRLGHDGPHSWEDES